MASKDTSSWTTSTDEGAIDRALVGGCQAGERDSRRRLYELCHGRVHRLMVRMVGSQDAPDLTQQVFLRVFRKIDQFAGKSKFETWLYRLAVNEALQHLRKRERDKVQPLGNEPLSRHAEGARRGEDQELLEEALARIDPELRSAFLLREVEGLSYEQVSEVLGIPEGTVGSRLNRARRELQQRLGELGWEP